MNKLCLAGFLALGTAYAGLAIAQTAAAGAGAAANSTAKQPLPMSATSSDSGNLGSGASSSALGTGTPHPNGVMSPTAPAASGEGVPGASPKVPATAASPNQQP